MKREELAKKIKETLGDKALNWHHKSPDRIYLDIDPKNIIEIAGYFHNDLHARFNIASGLDTPKGFEILYHFTFDKLNIVFSIRVLLKDKNNPQIDSITKVMPAAEWIEREMWELLGINFIGHPDMKKLLLPDDWPEGKYPLRRDYTEEKPWLQ